MYKLFDVEVTDNILTIDFSKSYKTLFANYFGVNEELITVGEGSKRFDVICLTFYSEDGNQSVKISGLFGELNKAWTIPLNITLSPSEVFF